MPSPSIRHVAHDLDASTTSARHQAGAVSERVSEEVEGVGVGVSVAAS